MIVKPRKKIWKPKIATRSDLKEVDSPTYLKYTGFYFRIAKLE